MIKKWQLIIVSAVLAGILLLTGCSGAAEAEDGDTVRVDYVLTLEDGTVYDESPEGEPFEFTIGSGGVISGFEDAVKGMKVGETKTVTIPPEEAYGEYNDALVQVVDRSLLPEDMVPVVGQYIMGQSSADGTTHTFLIMEVTDTTITVDGNSALAGKTLTFEITLVEIVADE